MAQISVIVPVYKVERYLDACVKSILTQTYKDFELILVDDGSPDRCGEMCDAYALQDQRIRVVHKTNGGLASARNAGLDVVQGEYVTFVDSDDVVHPQYLETLLTLSLKENADISMCYYDFFSNEGEWFSDVVDPHKVAYEVLLTADLLQNFWEHHQKVSLLSQCMKLYKKKVFNEFRMREGYTQEDSMALPYVLERADTIVRCKQKLYHWRETQGSISRSTFNKTNFHYIDAAQFQAEFFLERSSDQANFCMREVLFRTLKYYYKIQEQKPELMADFSDYLKRYRKLLPRYIRAKGILKREKMAYLLFFFWPGAAKKLYMQVYGERYQMETW